MTLFKFKKIDLILIYVNMYNIFKQYIMYVISIKTKTPQNSMTSSGGLAVRHVVVYFQINF